MIRKKIQTKNKKQKYYDANTWEYWFITGRYSFFVRAHWRAYAQESVVHADVCRNYVECCRTGFCGSRCSMGKAGWAGHVDLYIGHGSCRGIRGTGFNITNA